MDIKQEIKRNEDLIKSLESKRTDIFTFMAKEIKGNPRLEKAVEDLATVNGALEKAYDAMVDLEKAAQDQVDIEKAQKEQEEKDSLEEDNLEKAKDELYNDICESMRAEEEFTDEYVKELADKYSMSVDDIEDAIASAIEYANGGNPE